MLLFRPESPEVAGNEIRCYTKYGRASAGARVRVFDWLDQTNATTKERVFAKYDPLNRTSRYVASGLRYALNHRQLVREAKRMRLSNDRTLVYREATPFGGGSIECRLLRSGSFGVFDFDDAIHLQESAGRLGPLYPQRVKTEATLSYADRVIAGNEYLANFAAGHARDVAIIPSCVSPEKYERKTDYALKGFPVIGWIGSHSAERYLDTIREPLLELHKRLGVRILLIGATSERRGSLETMIDRVRWSEDNQHLMLRQVDVGIMPLPVTEFARGKCAYKLLQYGAAGIPSIGSPVGASTKVLHESGGWAPVNDSEWVDAVVEVLTISACRRKEIGEQAHKFVSENYSYVAWQSTWEQLVLGRPAQNFDLEKFHVSSGREPVAGIENSPGLDRDFSKVEKLVIGQQ
jgi:glycosyltransferase involved in cell wall biosynthesis